MSRQGEASPKNLLVKDCPRTPTCSTTLLLFFFVVVFCSCLSLYLHLRVSPSSRFSDKLTVSGATWHRVVGYIAEFGGQLVVAGAWGIFLLASDIGTLACSETIARALLLQVLSVIVVVTRTWNVQLRFRRLKLCTHREGWELRLSNLAVWVVGSCSWRFLTSARTLKLLPDKHSSFF